MSKDALKYSGYSLLVLALIGIIILNVTFINEKVKYHEFINDFIPQALEKNIFSFPIKKGHDLFDPKTNHKITKVYAPYGISLDAISQNPDLRVSRFRTKKQIPINSNALLYLPKPYLIAGSFHNEAYPHDTSYSIELFMDLIKSAAIDRDYAQKLLEITKDQLDNFYYEVKHFSYPLNGNRAYFSTRSQANTIVTNVKDYYEITKNKKWLKKKGIALAQGIIDYWLKGKVYLDKERQHFAFKWIADGSGKCFELMESYEDHDYFYDKIHDQLEAYKELQEKDDLSLPHFAKGFDYKKVLTKKNKSNLGLSYFYYYSDRLSKVSGYDTNSIYGPFNAFTDDFIPADHNLKLYKSLNDFIFLLNETEAEPVTIKKYSNIAKRLKESINKYLWDEEQGYFFEYNYKREDLRTKYGFLSSAYALWAEWFDIESSEDLEQLYKTFKYLKNNFKSKKGLYASNVETGIQWDKPYIWPIQQGMVIKGLMNYSKKLENLNPKKSKKFKKFALEMAYNFNNSNFQDWLKANGTSIKEKVTPEEETLFTGYATGENYTWNMATVLYFDSILN
ncbi:MAG: hypothetical protein HRT47_09265 [Candidatus Caenarcaniphilales bacterium]|nr:hypothetical protein [Candidatus Caenarcaniphilales bacterium]